MAAGELITVDTFATLFNTIKSVFAERANPYSKERLDKYFNNITINGKNGLATAADINKLWAAVTVLLDGNTNYTGPVNRGDLISESAYATIGYVVEILPTYTDKTANHSNGCGGACQGMCYGSCYSSCSGCTGGASGNTTTGDGNSACKSCGTTCTGTCGQTCSGCYGTCISSCAGSCSNVCTGKNSSNCGEAGALCKSGCQNTCTSCFGDCSGTS